VYDPDELAVWGVQAGSIEVVTDDLLRAWVAATGVTFPVMPDTAGTYGQYEAVGSTAPFPLDVIVDQQGTVQYVNTRYDPDAMAAVVEALLAD